MREKIIDSCRKLIKESEVQKGEYLSNYFDIDDFLSKIENSSDLNNIKLKVKEMKVKLKDCCERYRNLCQSFKIHENELTMLIGVCSNEISFFNPTN